MHDSKKMELLEAFAQLIEEAGEAFSAKARGDNWLLYKALQLNYDLFLEMYPMADGKISRGRDAEAVRARFKALNDFYRQHCDSLPGRSPSRLGKFFSAMAIVIGLASIVVACTLAPPVAAGVLLATVGVWGWKRSQGTGYSRVQAELVSELAKKHRI